jgi:hypothetical protein
MILGEHRNASLARELFVRLEPRVHLTVGGGVGEPVTSAARGTGRECLATAAERDEPPSTLGVACQRHSYLLLAGNARRDQAT